MTARVLNYKINHCLLQSCTEVSAGSWDDYTLCFKKKLYHPATSDNFNIRLQ